MRLLTKKAREESRLAQIQFLREKYDASVVHVYNLIIVKYESDFQEGKRPMVQIWRANAAKPYANYYFRSEQSRQTYIDQQIASAESWIARNAEYKRKRENDPSFRNRRNETQAVKKLLADFGINAKVTHGRGTAYGWLEINIGAGQQFGDHREDENRSHYRCPRCNVNNLIRQFVLDKVGTLTGRSGEYHGRTLVLSQDAWSDKACCSIPIEHDLEKLIESIPEIKEVTSC